MHTRRRAAPCPLTPCSTASATSERDRPWDPNRFSSSGSVVRHPLPTRKGFRSRIELYTLHVPLSDCAGFRGPSLRETHQFPSPESLPEPTAVPPLRATRMVTPIARPVPRPSRHSQSCSCLQQFLSDASHLLRGSRCERLRRRLERFFS